MHRSPQGLPSILPSASILSTDASAVTQQDRGLRTGDPGPVVKIAPTAEPKPKATTAPKANCHPSYSPCVPSAGHDLDCPDIGFRVRVKGPDTYRLDRDHDGWGCESY
jgi:hypothetical protein